MNQLLKMAKNFIALKPPTTEFATEDMTDKNLELNQTSKIEEISLMDTTRKMVAHRYLTGKGIEIGALYNPLAIPESATVKYVDRLAVKDLREQYPELKSFELVEVDIIDNGELLETIRNQSQNFVIANHFIEHCQDPIQAISNLLRVLKPLGILYLAVPDKRYSFDCDRAITPLEHLLRDYHEGPAWSKKQHFEEWVRLVNKTEDEATAQWQINELMRIDYSIHYHVWTQVEFIEFILAIKKILKLEFEIEMCLKNDTEFITILRKS
jgi:2-polyprenyl-3-methyl-5-hydroxy-6-metoxy-1,4-benzoquinol methylase